MSGGWKVIWTAHGIACPGCWEQVERVARRVTSGRYSKPQRSVPASSDHGAEMARE